MNKKLPYLNLGCGFQYHKDWTNIDFIKTGEDVIPYNLTEGIPAASETFEVVYHSHVLEHFSKEGGRKFLQECFRVLKPKGIIRIAVPDLERIVDQYTKILSELKSDPDNVYLQANYDWILLEMYDQTVRNQSGGNMYEYLKQPTLINKDFLIQRNGHEVEGILEQFEKIETEPARKEKPSFFAKLRSTLNIHSLPHTLKTALVKKVLGKDLPVYEIGKFRVSGEVHQWMYDQYSLGRLLRQTGFSEVQVQTATTSKIADWQSFGLEVSNNKVRKPDSLFIEAVKN